MAQTEEQCKYSKQNARPDGPSYCIPALKECETCKRFQYVTRVEEVYIVTSKRCLRCRWSIGYHNWTMPDEPKLPDTFYCMNSKVSEITADCSAYDTTPIEKYNED